jgi:hypothetical protein
MMGPSTGTTFKAYASEENVDLGGSRFVGPVELRGARGRVWLRGRRMPSSWLWTHASGHVAGWLARVAAWVFWWEWWIWPLSSRNEDMGDIWLTYKTRAQTVSWSVAESRLVSSLPLAQTRVSQSEAALPALMGVRRITLKTATEALEKARKPSDRVQLEVPLGRKGGMMQLYLEVSDEHRDAVIRVLSGAEARPTA